MPSGTKIRRILKLMNELNADGDVKNTGLEKTYASNTYVQEALGSAGVPSGTKQIFVQTAAPTGWTKETSHNDKALRVVSGTASNGGIDSFSTTFGSGKTTDSHTLSTPQIPSHTHGIIADTSGQPTILRITAGYGPGATITNFSVAEGGGGAHSHNLNLDIAYVDTIIATKD
jgi:hypothetical protein